MKITDIEVDGRVLDAIVREVGKDDLGAFCDEVNRGGVAFCDFIKKIPGCGEKTYAVIGLGVLQAGYTLHPIFWMSPKVAVFYRHNGKGVKKPRS